MSQRAHAILSASAAERWINCPPSARLTENMPDTASSYAATGTLAHAIAELYLRKRFTATIGPKAYAAELKKLQASEHYSPDIDRALAEYYDLVERTYLSYANTPHIAIELRLDLTPWVPEGFGTADCVIVGGNALHVIDYKNGRGVPVGAEDNPQMLLYALGALKHYEMLYDIQHVIMTICQPNIDNTWSYSKSADTLRAWGESIKPIAQTAFDGGGDFAAGDWCRFCKARATCRARADEHLALVGYGDKLPPALTPAEVGSALTQGRNLVAWLNDLEEYALSACLAGEEIPGWKAVSGRALRQWDSLEAAFIAAIESGIDEAMLYERKPLTLAAVEKMMGKSQFATVLGEHVYTPPGKPTLASATDKRQAITDRPTAQEDFGKPA
ncbi:MAG: DUF2800 domain-containing protein [Betaproteobacteria bacterium]|nr:DUF2800 domain-containing protein [Betaproteobacteria bacterium]